MFLDRVLELIDSHGITRNKLLTDVGLNKNSFVAWGNRGTIPGGDTLAKIANYFEVSTDYLLGLTDDPAKKPAPEEGGGLDEEQMEIVRLYRAAAPELQAAALAVLRSAEGQSKAPGGVSEGK